MSWILNRRTHTAILRIKYGNLLKTALRFYGRVFQCPLSTRLSQCSVLLQKFLGSEQSTLGHYIPPGSTEGRYSIRRQARNFGSLGAAFTAGVFSVRVNPRDIWHLPNATEPGFWFLLGTIITLAKSLSQWSQITSKHESHSCNNSVSKRLSSH